MRRARPLIGMIWLVTLLCTALSLVTSLLDYALLVSGSFRPELGIHWFTPAFADGIFTGLSLAIPMAVVTIVFFRDIQKPTFYRFAMVSVALLVTIARWGWMLEMTRWVLERQLADVSVSFVIYSLSHVFTVFSCHFAAGKYLRDASTSTQKSAS